MPANQSKAAASNGATPTAQPARVTRSGRRAATARGTPRRPSGRARNGWLQCRERWRREQVRRNRHEIRRRREGEPTTEAHLGGPGLAALEDAQDVLVRAGDETGGRDARGEVPDGLAVGGSDDL